MATNSIKKVEEVKDFDFGNRKEVMFVSNGKSQHMPKGSEYLITVEMAKLFLSKSYGTIKN